MYHPVILLALYSTGPCCNQLLYIRGVGATSSSEGNLCKIVGIPSLPYCFSSCFFFKVLRDTPSVPGCTHRPSCTLLEFVLHLVPVSLTFFSLSYFDGRPKSSPSPTSTVVCHNNATTVCLLCSRPLATTTFLTLTRNVCASNQNPALYHLPFTALYHLLTVVTATRAPSFEIS